FLGSGQYSVPQMQKGGLTVGTFAVYLEDHHLDHALQRGLEMTWYLLQEVRENPVFELIKTTADIRRIKKEKKVGGILAFEGLEPLEAELKFLDIFYELGLRMGSLTHNRRNFFADGKQPGVKLGGLTHLGQTAVKRMNELGIVIDVGHINQTGFWDILELTSEPIVFSHIGPSALLLPSDQHKPGAGYDMPEFREPLEALVKNGAVIGMIFFGEKNVDSIIDHIETLLDIVGPDHIGLGSDYCGFEYSPEGFDDISKLPLLTRRLVERGHSDEVILKILGENYMRVFDKVWK
ncbi:MAG: membrane dipeptidase, partial [Anaerolineaceae bacterium]|nr:membrane dipeptidase [Anaerolineaceae bacterium]